MEKVKITQESSNGHAEKYNSLFEDFISHEKETVKLMSAVGKLLYEKGVELVLFRIHLVDSSVSQILQFHEYARKVVEKPIDIYITTAIANEMLSLDLAPSKIDVGLLGSQWIEQKDNYNSIADFLADKLNNFIGQQKLQIKPKDVVLFGFGRIGRLAAREIIMQAGKGQQLRLRAIVTRNTSDENIMKRAALLRNDSVHGKFNGSVIEDMENKQLIINGQLVKLIESATPDGIDYESFGLNDVLVIDNTGKYKEKDTLGLHLKSKGVSKVLLTAPGKEMPNVVYGINHDDLDLENDALVSAASCTTNAIVPILKVVEDELGIEKGHIETIHAYTNDQNLLDNMHKKNRRGRSAPLNMVITSTGAAKAVSKVLPSLSGKLTANAVRVPTPNGSLAILNLSIKQETCVDNINQIIKKAALKGDLVNQINYRMDKELVSTDIIGNRCAAVYDSKATIVFPDGYNALLYVWYDNEYGYTKQVVRLAKHMAKVRRLIYY